MEPAAPNQGEIDYREEWDAAEAEPLIFGSSSISDFMFDSIDTEGRKLWGETEPWPEQPYFGSPLFDEPNRAPRDTPMGNLFPVSIDVSPPAIFGVKKARVENESNPIVKSTQEPHPVGASLSGESTSDTVQHPRLVIMGSPTPDTPVTPVQPNAISEKTTSARVEDNIPFRCDSSYRIGDVRCNGKLLWPLKCTSYIKRRYQCLGENQGEKCSTIPKDSRAFNRHYSTVHIRDTEKEKLDCSFEGCHRVGEEGFTRRDNLLQHLRSVHGEDIPHNPVRFNGWGDDGKPRIRGG